MNADTVMDCPQCGFGLNGDAVELRTSCCIDERLNELLSCNDPPLEHEAKGLIVSNRENLDVLSHLEERITPIDKTLNNLLEKKKKILVRVQEAQVVLHPLRSTPPEVLAEIFRFVVDDFEEQSTQLENCLQMTYPSWVLSHVSSRWRETALCTPHLWTHLACNFDYGHSLSQVFLLGAFISRSYGRKLTVSLQSTRTIVGHPSLPTILLTCPRWHFAALSLPPFDYQSFNHIPGTFDHLESIILSMSAAITDDQLPPGCVTAFKHAPLTSIGVTGSIRLLHRIVDLPWYRIDNFHYEGFQANTSTSLAILEATKNLRHAEIYIGGTLPTNIHLCPNDSIQSLSFTGCIKNATKLLPRLRMPHLTHLQMQLHEHHTCGGRRVLQPLSSPTGQLIRNMSLAMLDAEGEEINGMVSLLASTPVLDRLEMVLVKECDTDQLCAMLLKDAGLVQDLTVLILKGTRGLNISQQLIHLINSRRINVDGNVLLRRVKIDYGILVDDNVQAAFAELVNEGLEGYLLSKTAHVP